MKEIIRKRIIAKRIETYSDWFLSTNIFISVFIENKKKRKTFFCDFMKPDIIFLYKETVIFDRRKSIDNLYSTYIYNSMSLLLFSTQSITDERISRVMQLYTIVRPSSKRSVTLICSLQGRMYKWKYSIWLTGTQRVYITTTTYMDTYKYVVLYRLCRHFAVIVKQIHNSVSR